MDCQSAKRRSRCFIGRLRSPLRGATAIVLSLSLLGTVANANADSDEQKGAKPLLLFELENEANEEQNRVVEPPKVASVVSERSATIKERLTRSPKNDPAALKPSLEETDQTELPAASVKSSDVRYEQEGGAANLNRAVVESETTVYYEEEPGLFPNLRPFRRARARFFNSHAAPAPPAVEIVDPEKTVVVTAAKPTMLTLENDSLPPLDLETAKENDPVTKADVEALREEAKGFVWKKGDLKITPYGFLNLAVSSDTQRAIPGEYILYLQNPDVDNTADFAVDARTSRIGLKIEGPRIEALNATLGGQAEFDFQGVASGSKNKGGVQLRRAFAELVDAQHERRFVFGQDWEIISPGAPQMLNYLPGAFAGNIQYRRAQARVEQGWTSSPDLHLLGQIGIFDDVLGDYTSTAGVSPASAAWPVIEGRFAIELFKQARCGLPITIGLSGHIGEQRFTFSPIAGVPIASTAERKKIKTWSANLDVDLPITKKFKLQGEYYQGSNLSSFCGAINQGVDLYRREAIDDRGWWAAVHYDWTKQLATNVGYGVDKPKGSDLVGTSLATNGVATARTKNQIYFTNVIYNWTANFMTGLEFSYWQTGYQKTDVSGSSPSIISTKTADALRTEFVTRLSF